MSLAMGVNSASASGSAKGAARAGVRSRAMTGRKLAFILKDFCKKSWVLVCWRWCRVLAGDCCCC